MTKAQILQDIADSTAPGVMSQRQALEFLEDLSSDIEAMMDGLRDDLKNAEEDD